ncbi:DNA internalization-related competence protein ComEC/Rec2 [Culicoidibacter larvae]|uniref:DNA internalization-related competence protein ComEC/Rec2 n=1 Tax=Culicoidibacter larvae TaxID=2579976 RepID=UPI001484E901|nr:DNA internalization-related competence protein ComEC/Rec2 [Culicoidibacter larvae]
MNKLWHNSAFYIVIGVICGACIWHFNHVAVFFLLFGLGYCYYHKHSNYFIIGCMLILGSLFLNNCFQGSVLNINNTEWQGVIATEPKIDGDSIQFRLKIDDFNETIVVYLRVGSESERELQREQLHVGNKIRFTGNLDLPQQLHNFSLFDYQHYLNIHGIYYIAYINDITILGNSFSIQGLIYQYIRDSFPENIQPYMRAFILGDMAAIEQSYTNIWQSLGVIHLFALSGFHIQFLIRSLRKLASRLWIPQELISILLIGFLIFYMYITGFSASVVRAGLMAIIGIFFSLQNRRVTSFGICNCIFLLMSLTNPLLLEQSGFQFSFMISYAIILSQKYVSQLRYGRQLFSSFLIQIVSVPIVIWHYYEFSMLTFIYNLIFIPFASIFVIPSVFVTFCIPILSPFLSLLIYVFEQFSILLATLPQLIITVGRLPIIYMCILMVVILVVFILLSMRHRRVNCVIALLLGLLLVPCLHPLGSITIVDIGQGDCIVMSIPFVDGAVVIDTGGKVSYGNTASWSQKLNSSSLAERIIIPTIKALGHNKIHTLFLSHADQDHMGEAAKLAENISIGQVVLSKSDASLQEKFISQNLEEWHIPVIYASSGDNIAVGRQLFQILLPNDFTSSLDENNKSLVIYTKLGDASWLFTGDLEAEGEEELMRLYPQLTATHLKVGHHGSKTSSSDTLLSNIQSQYSYISAGRNNRYKHPHQNTLEHLLDANNIIYRTDVHGAVRYYSFWFWNWHEIVISG